MTYAPLPSFEKPPVHEVAMSLVFAPLRGFESRHFGALWQKFQHDYPLPSEHPPIQAQIEQFGVPGRQQVRLELMQRPELRRQWFVAKNDMELIQIQDDRFVRNWRKREDNEYPRFHSLLVGLERDWASFNKVLEAERLPQPQVIQCELDYVNHIDETDGVKLFQGAGAVFHPLASGFSDEYLNGRDVDDVFARFSFPMKIKPEDSQPIGRLRVSLESRVTVTKSPTKLLRLILSARGRPLDKGWEGAKAFFEVGREWIVRGFKSATTEQAHDIWGGPNWDLAKLSPKGPDTANERKNADV